MLVQMTFIVCGKILYEVFFSNIGRGNILHALEKSLERVLRKIL